MNGPENLVGILDVSRHVRERLAGAFDAAEVLVDPDDDIPLRRVLSKAPKPIHRDVENTSDAAPEEAGLILATNASVSLANRQPMLLQMYWRLQYPSVPHVRSNAPAVVGKLSDSVLPVMYMLPWASSAIFVSVIACVSAKDG